MAKTLPCWVKVLEIGWNRLDLWPNCKIYGQVKIVGMAKGMVAITGQASMNFKWCICIYPFIDI